MVQQLRVSRRMRVVGVGMAFACTSFVMAVTAPAAHATDAVEISTCGQSVTTDAVLVKNLVCPGDGVIIAADGVTVDLGGHVLRSSTGAGRGVVIGGPFGSAATVRGPGKVKGFGTGIAGGPEFWVSHHAIVDGVALLDNYTGIASRGSTIDVSGTTIRATNGIVIGFDSVVNIDGSSVTSTGIAIGDDPRSEARDRIHVTNSQLRGGSMSLSQDSGLVGEDSTFANIGSVACSESYVSMARSRLVNTSFSFQAECNGSFTDNTIRSTSGGIALNLISRSWPGTFPVSGNRFSGWDEAVVIGVYFERAEITGNRFEHNVTGIHASASPGPTPDCSAGDDGVIRNNTLVHNSGDAVVLCGQWAVGGNRLLSNGGVGIAAAGAQITDEGGNIARGNADPQCVGVVCVPR